MTFILNIWINSTFLRYAVAGFSSSGLEISLLFILTEFFGVYYLMSAVVAMTIAFFIRFILQKLLAFKDVSLTKIHTQLLFYSILYVGSMISTVGLLYFFVEKLHIWYVFAQIITIGIIATVSFFIYKHIIFFKEQII